MASVTPLRFSGMASGIDTDGIIKSMLQIQQLKVDREVRSQINLQWKQDGLKQINSDITEFKNSYLSVLGSKNVFSSATFNTRTASIVGTNSGAVSVTANGDAPLGVYTIDEVTQLASGANVTSGMTVSNSGKGFSASAKFGDMEFNSFGISGIGALKLDFGTDDAPKTIQVKINDAEFTITKDTKLSEFVNQVNASAGANATITYDGLTDKFKVESKTMGSTSTLTIQQKDSNGDYQDGGDFLDALRIGTTPGGAQGDRKAGTLAEFKVNGQAVVRDSNSFTANGLNFKLNAVTVDPNDPTKRESPVRIEVKQDVTATVDKIKDFVDAYNSLVGKLNKLVSESKTTTQRKYTPLTDTDKEGMTEAQIKLWEDTAKIGLFHGDTGLNNMLTNMRNALYSKVGETGLSPADIGLGTFSFTSGSGWREKAGQIELNVDKLKAALEKDPDAVAKVFTATPPSGTATSTANNVSNSGLFVQALNSFNSYESNYRSDAVISVTDQLNNQIKRVSELEDKINALSESYYKKFAAMETAIQKLQDQSSSITNLLSSSSK